MASSSSSVQQSSVTKTTNVTSDSFNRTNNVVTNTSDSGNIDIDLSLGEPSDSSGLSVGAGTVSMLVVGSILIVAVMFLFRKK